MRAPVPTSDIQDRTCGLTISNRRDKRCVHHSKNSRRQNSMPYFSKIYSPENRKASHKEFPWQVLIPDGDIRCAGTLVKLDVRK